MSKHKFICGGLILLWLLLLGVGMAQARGRRAMRGTGYSYSGVDYAPENRTAQGIANIMARLRVVGHFGGNPGYEGCGMSSTREGAYAICCFANSGMRTVDVGYAQDENGMWYCCRRYE